MISLSEHPLWFVLPHDSDAISGGNIYNRELIAALRRSIPIHTCSIEQCAQHVAAAKPGLYFLDTLNMGDRLAFTERRRGQFFGLIVHHLPSLEPDIDPQDESLRVEEAALARFDLYLATSAFTASLLADRGISESKVITVPPGLPAIEGISSAYEPPARGLMVGNLIPRKAVRELLESLERRLAHAPIRDGWEIEIVGRTDLDPAYAEACQKLVAGSPSLARAVRFRGPIPYEQMHDLYGRAHVLLSAAKMETFGMALSEARAWGLPILAYDGGNTRHHVRHGENGMIFDSVGGVADAFLRLAEKPREMQRLIEDARALREGAGYSWGGAAERFLEGLRGPRA